MVVAIAAPGASAARVRSWGARQICSTQDHLSGRGWSGGCRLVVTVVADGFPLATGLCAAQGDDGVGAFDGPVHAGLLEPLVDDGLAACLHHAGADEQAAGAEPVVAHAGRVGQEVAQFLVRLVLLDAFEGVLATAASMPSM